MTYKHWLLGAALAGLSLAAMPMGVIFAEEEKVTYEAAAPEWMMENPLYLVSEIRAYKDERNWTALISLSTQAIERYPQMTIFYFSRGTGYMQMGENEKALSDINAAMRIEPKAVDVHLMRALIYGSMQRYEEGLADLAWVHSQNQTGKVPDAFMNTVKKMEPEYLCGYGVELLERGETEKALAAANQAIEMAPDFVIGYQLRRDVYRKMGDFEKSQHDHYMGLALLTEKQGMYTAAVSAYTMAHEYDKAIALLDEEIKKTPDDDDLYSLRGLTYADDKQYEKAVADYTKAIKMKPTAERYNNRGEIYRQMKQYDKAKADLDTAYRLDPAYPPLLDTIGTLAYDQGEYEKAIQFLTKAIEKEPYSQSFATRAKAYKALGKEDLAAADEKSAAEWEIKEKRENIIH